MAFVGGAALSEAYYREVVQPLLGETGHCAALLGWGSDVLGFDTERSTDHGWGPRMQVFVDGPDVEPVQARLESDVPGEFRGRPTRFGWDDHPAILRVEVATLGDWLKRTLGFDVRGELGAKDWASLPSQLLLSLTSGAVHHDGLGEVHALRERLAWYPRDIWLWLLACQWRRIDQEEPFVGRTAEVGDEIGSRVLAARLVRDVMRLCFLIERRYAPYAKWLGSAFAQLASADSVGRALALALDASDYAAREDALVEAYELVAAMHNELGLTPPIDPTPRLFHSRPFRVIGAGRFAEACMAAIDEDEVRALGWIGGVDQWADSTDLLSDPGAIRSFWRQ